MDDPFLRLNSTTVAGATVTNIQPADRIWFIDSCGSHSSVTGMHNNLLVKYSISETSPVNNYGYVYEAHGGKTNLVTHAGHVVSISPASELKNYWYPRWMAGSVNVPFCAKIEKYRKFKSNDLSAL